MAKKIDLEALRQQINELQIDKNLKHDLLAAINDKQRYGLVWEESSEEAWDEMQDKLPVFVEDATKRLDSAPEGSPNHVLIEGDNLNALAALTYAYAGNIDVIYIDPPYNTGNKDFIYNDSFVDKEDGYRHSKWLSFMDRRLRIAKKLLSESGFIFISIDDNEFASLKLLCDYIFGENNCRNIINTRRLDKNLSQQFIKKGIKSLAVGCEYILVYSASDNSNFYPIMRESSDERKDYGYWKGFWNAAERPTMRYELCGFKPETGQWKWKKEKALEAVANYEAFLKAQEENPALLLEDYWKQTGKNLKFVRRRYGHTKGKNMGVEHWVEPSEGILRTSNWSDIITTEISLNMQIDFSSPKSIKLIKEVLKFSNGGKDATILDFFAGSGTTLHATMQLNSEDGGHRKCILVTNNENNICERVTYERNKRVINGYTNQKGEEVPGLSHNNLRYYKTEFVPRDQSSSKSRRALMASLVDLLCIKNNIYKEQETFGGKKFKKNVLRYFKDEAGQMLVVLDECVVSIIIPMIAEVATKQNPLKVYVYSDGAYAYEDEFHKVMPVIELCAMPDAFLQALEGGTDILPKQKYSEAMMKEFQQNEALAMQNEEVVKEALSDDYDYVLKEKEDNVTNDIID